MGLSVTFRRATRNSLVTKGDHGIHAHGAARGKVRGSESHEEQEQREARKKKQIDADDTEDQAAHGAVHGKRNGYSDGKANSCEFHCLTQDQFHYVAGFGAESEANANLRYAPGDAFRENPVDSEGRQRQSHTPKQRHQHTHNADNRDGISDLSFQCADTRQSDLIVNAANHVSDAGNIAWGIGGYAHQKNHRALRYLKKGFVNRRAAGGIPPVLSHVFDHAYDGHPRFFGIRRSELDLMTQLIAI